MFSRPGVVRYSGQTIAFACDRNGSKPHGPLRPFYNPRTNLTATAIFGGLTPLVAQYATTASGWPSTPGLMIAIVALAVLPLLWRMKETAPPRSQPSNVR